MPPVKKKEVWWVVDEHDGLQLECGSKKEASSEAAFRRKETREKLRDRIKNLSQDIHIECRKEE